MKSELRNRLLCVVLVTAGVLVAGVGRGAETKETAADKQRQLIAVLQSNAEPGEKALACKRLAIYGNAEAVPELAKLLPNADLSSWARIALEAIPDPVADAALRKALGQLHGRLLVGVINSIGYRRDAKAVSALTAKLSEVDPDVVSAAAVSLGKIGGTKAAAALHRSLTTSPIPARSSVAEGCVRCAEHLLADGKRSDAIKLYDAVRAAAVPKQDVLEGTRGAILARGSSGLPMLLEELRSPDRGHFAMALRTSRELPGHPVTQALAEEMRGSSPQRQPLILLALAGRGDPEAMPVILGAAKDGSKGLRLAAIRVLERSGDLASVAVLIDLAVQGDSELAPAAKTALARLPAAGAESDLRNRLAQSSGKTRQVLLELAEQRRIEGVLPLVVQSANDPDAGIRRAALHTLGAIGDDKQAAELVQLLKQSHSAEDRADIESALLAISGRSGVASVPSLLPLAQSEDSSIRILALHALASAGGPDALNAVKGAVSDKDESVQDEAVRTLSSWPNTWPEDQGVAEPLLDLARSAAKSSHQVLALRGYIQYVQGDKNLNNKDKVERLSNALALARRPEEKRLAIAAVRSIPTAGALQVLSGLVSEAPVAEDACSAIVEATGGKMPGVSKEDRQKALQSVVDVTSSETTKKKAEDLLKGLN
jgi:HEAT repeat protein